MSRISDDAILGMPFLKTRRFSMDLTRPVLQLDERELTWTDRGGRLLVSYIKVIQAVVIPLRTNTLLEFSTPWDWLSANWIVYS